jgi:CRP/FNR family cyclic AMP-dependent transcriptional regulator
MGRFLYFTAVGFPEGMPLVCANLISSSFINPGYHPGHRTNPTASRYKYAPMKKIWYFEKVDLFEILCPYKYADHVKHHPPFSYHRNDFLFLPNDLAREIYLVTCGKVKVGYYDDEGNEYVKTYLSKGEILGEMAFLGQGVHHDFAQAAEEGTQVCKMSVEKARELARDYVPFSLEIHRKIGENIRKLERRLEILFFKDAHKRLIELLKDLKAMYGKPCPKGKGILVEHALTQQEMASLIATSRKTVAVILNEFERDGKIELGLKKFWVLNDAFLN